MSNLKRTILIHRVLMVAIAIMLIACIFILVRFGPGIHKHELPSPARGDFSTHLAGNYWLHRTAPFNVVITPESYSPHDTPFIPTVVTHCATDGRYILAKRHGMKRSNPSDPTDTSREMDSTQVDFWILDTEHKNIQGPLTEQQFLIARKELSIDPTLQLRDAHQFRPPSPSQSTQR